MKLCKSMKYLIIILGLAVLNIQAEEWDFDTGSKELVQKHWQKYKLTFNKQYETETEEHFRLYFFLDSVLQVQEHNNKYSQGLASFEAGINQFSDMPHSEFLQKLITTERTLNKTESAISYIPPAHVQVPVQVDWRKAGAVTEVKNQSLCNSCYSFSATGALEGQQFRKNEQLVSLSEQNIVDCSKKYGNNGCNMGLADYAFKYIKENDGIDTEDSYPYEGQDGTCRYDPTHKGATDKGFVEIKPRTEENLKAAVGTQGPIAISIDARHPSLKIYKKGVYFEPNCKSKLKYLGHAVLAVGYGTDPEEKENPEYWLVKNSWGTNWGEDGYIRIARNKKDHCGVAKDALYPLV